MKQCLTKLDECKFQIGFLTLSKTLPNMSELEFAPDYSDVPGADLILISSE